MYTPKNTKNRQSGAVLVISLIMLMLLTMIGVSSSQNAGMEERMAGNSRDKNLAFQAAESALLTAEQSLVTAKAAGTLGTTSPVFNGTGGYYLSTPTADILADSFWDNNTIASGSLDGVIVAPRYIIQDLGLNAITGQHNYRITAHAFGGTQNAAVILQSIFRI